MFFLIQLLIIKFHSARNYIKVSFRSLLFKIIRLIFYVRHFFYWRIVFSSEVLVIVTILLHEDLCDLSDLKCKPNITQMNQCSQYRCNSIGLTQCQSRIFYWVYCTTSIVDHLYLPTRLYDSVTPETYQATFTNDKTERLTVS